MQSNNSMDPAPPPPSKSLPPSKNPLTDRGKSIAAVKMDKTKKKKRKLQSGYTSDTASSSRTSSFQKVRVRNRRVVIGSSRHKEGDVDSIALPLGMSIAAVVAQVLERKECNGGAMPIDHLSKICTLAVRESLANVFGDKFDIFGRNFEKSFRSTLMTLRLINENSQHSGEQEVHSNYESIDDNAIPPISLYKELRITSRLEDHRSISEDNFSNQGARSNLVRDLHDGERNTQLACISRCSTISTNNGSTLNTFEKSVVEQTRANDLKTFEISLAMKKLQLKEQQLALNSDLNFLERWKISMGISKASFKAGKFKYEVEETRHAELLRKCIDCLVASLFIMLASIAYGTYVFALDRITEATSSCMPSKGSKPWWMLKPMASFNSGMITLWCQIQTLSRMLFGTLLILAIAYLLLQRSTASTQTMPITFILLLGFACGLAGKLCIDTLGGSGYIWLLYWEILCVLHFLSNVFTAALFLVLYGPVDVSRVMREKSRFPYWLRRVIFHAVVLVFLPLLCGLTPFASVFEWKDHFKLRMIDFLRAPGV